MSVQDITEALKICKCNEDDEPCKQCPIREKNGMVLGKMHLEFVIFS